MLRIWATGETHAGFSWGDLLEGDYLGNLGIDGRIILKWIFKKSDEESWTGMLWYGWEQVPGACECGNEPSGFIKWGEFLWLHADLLASQGRCSRQLVNCADICFKELRKSKNVLSASTEIVTEYLLDEVQNSYRLTVVKDFQRSVLNIWSLNVMIPVFRSIWRKRDKV